MSQIKSLLPNPIESRIRNKKLFLLDVDGTISFDATPFEGTLDFLRQVKASGGKYIFITNNSTKSIADYIVKFTGMGIEVDESNFLTASYVAAQYLLEHHREDRIHVLGTESFRKELQSFGLSVTEGMEEDIRAVVVGFDNELTYEKVTRVCELLQTRELPYYGTNPDLACPVGFGYIPDCGAICGMIANAIDRQPVYLGKPNRIMVDMAIQQTGFLPEQTLVIGDRLYTDIACGIQGEVDTLLVFTGEAKPEDLAETEFPPTYYCDSILDVYRCLVDESN